MTQQTSFLTYLSSMLSALSFSASGFAQSPATNPQATNDDIQKVEVIATSGKQTISYRAVQTLWHPFRDQVQYEPREIDSVLLVHPNEEAQDGFYARYLDENGVEKIIEIGKHGILDLPPKSSDVAKNIILEMHSKNKITIISYAPHYMPRINNKKKLDFNDYNNFIVQTNKSVSDVPWYAKLLLFGRLKARANGIQFCFRQENAFLEIEGVQIPVDKNGCISHRINQEYLHKKPEIIFNGDLEFSIMLFEN